MDDLSRELWRGCSSLTSSTKLDKSGQKCCLLSVEKQSDETVDGVSLISKNKTTTTTTTTTKNTLWTTLKQTHMHINTF